MKNTDCRTKLNEGSFITIFTFTYPRSIIFTQLKITNEYVENRRNRRRPPG